MLMINPFRALGSALRDLFDDFLLLIVCNLLWAVLTIPILLLALSLLTQGAPGLAAAVALVGVLPAGPATVGLYYVANRITDGLAAKISDFFVGMRRHARIGLLLTLIAAVGLGMILFNLGFYLGVNNLFGGLMIGLWLYLLIAWLGVLIYAFPLAFLQERPELRLIGRNALLMAMGRPIFTLLTLAMMALIFAVSAYFIVPVMVFTPALIALWATRATTTLIADARRRREEADSATSEPLPEEKGRKGQVRPK